MTAFDYADLCQFDDDLRKVADVTSRHEAEFAFKLDLHLVFRDDYQFASHARH